MARVVFCEACGAPLDAPWKEIAIVCQYCGAQSLPGKPGEHVPSSMPADGRPRLNLAGRTYLVEGKLASGASCEVYRARWVKRLGELVVIKVLRSRADADLLRREWSFLERLHGSRATGVDHFSTLLPQPIAYAPVTTERHGERWCAVFQWPAGFVHPLTEVRQVWPMGVDGRVAVWMLRRLCELLGWVHSAGVVHGAVLPEHVLIQPRGHGARLVGWSAASAKTRDGWEPLVAITRSARAFYPEDAWSDRVAGPRIDVQMASRCALSAWGEQPGDPHIPDAVSGPVAVVMRQGARGEFDDALALRDAVGAASDEQFGPPSYNPLPMPGWG